MGATTFYTSANGATANEAFKKAVEKAKYDHGHSGYTGTIAEKSSFILLGEVLSSEAYSKADKMIDEADSRVDDKWGPAGCFKITDKPNTWYFFGWASN